MPEPCAAEEVDMSRGTKLAGKSVLVTGATGGLGQAIARRLHAEGCALTLSARRSESLDALAAEVDGRAVAADLSDAGETEKLARECAGVDILVANAGLPGTGLLEEYTIEQLDRVLSVNLRAPVVLARTIGERMLARRHGHVIFVSSLLGKLTLPRSSLYHATKFGLRGFARGLRADWRSRGVGVSCVCPGPVTGAGMFHDGGGRMPIRIGIPSPGDVANAVVKAITRNRAEIDVMDALSKSGMVLDRLAPGSYNLLGKPLGIDAITVALAKGQQPKR
jgi:short-subunit dehydrogenase